MIAAGLVLFIAFLWRSISASTGAVMAVLVTVLFYPIALVHYQMRAVHARGILVSDVS